MSEEIKLETELAETSMVTNTKDLSGNVRRKEHTHSNKSCSRSQFHVQTNGKTPIKTYLNSFCNMSGRATVITKG